MEQYIPKSALLVEIERLVNNYNKALDYDKALDYEAALEDVRNFLDSLEVKGVDLNKEIKKVQRKYKTIEEYKGYPCTMYANNIEWIAKHFFELGMLQTQKGE